MKGRRGKSSINNIQGNVSVNRSNSNNNGGGNLSASGVQSLASSLNDWADDPSLATTNKASTTTSSSSADVDRRSSSVSNSNLLLEDFDEQEWKQYQRLHYSNNSSKGNKYSPYGGSNHMTAMVRKQQREFEANDGLIYVTNFLPEEEYQRVSTCKR